MGEGTIENEMRHIAGRQRSHHKRIGGLEVKVSNIERDLSVTQTEVAGLKDDIKEVKEVVEREGEANRASNNRLLMALVGFALTAAGSAITVAITVGGGT